MINIVYVQPHSCGTFRMPIVMFALAAVAVSLFLRSTRWGAYIYALGDNPFGARTTGIPAW